MTDFTGLVAIVTGGASGIGAATAELLDTARRARRGAGPRPHARSPPSPPWPCQCDVTDTAAVQEAVATVAEQLGGIDVVVNNAGIGAVGDVAANDDEEWHRVLDVNVVGIARVTRAALPHLRRSAHAAIVNTCSVAAPVGLPQRAVYAASKGAVASLTLAMAADHVREGIRVNAVTPGTADTPWVARLLAPGRRSRGGGPGSARAPADGPPGQRRGGRARHRLPGQPPVGLDHRHPARGRRRHGGAPAAPLDHRARVVSRQPGEKAGEQRAKRVRRLERGQMSGTGDDVM